MGEVNPFGISLDSVNYLLKAEDVQRCFACVHNYLDPDGLFIFDVNTPYKFRNIYGDYAYILEDEIADGEDATHAVYCGWQNQYDEKSGICDFYLTLFEEQEDGSYSRTEEHQRERCYSLEQLRTWLEEAGFTFLGAWSDYQFSTPTADTPRWYIAARCQKPCAN